jgi:hypothetical protein
MAAYNTRFEKNNIPINKFLVCNSPRLTGRVKIPFNLSSWISLKSLIVELINDFENMKRNTRHNGISFVEYA